MHLPFALYDAADGIFLIFLIDTPVRDEFSMQIVLTALIFYILFIDEFDKNLNVELSKNLYLPSYNSNGKRCRNRKGRLSESEIMPILVRYHFGTYRNFKEYY